MSKSKVGFVHTPIQNIGIRKNHVLFELIKNDTKFLSN